MEYEIHPHTGALISKRTYIQDADGYKAYMDDSFIDELIETGQITIVVSFGVD